MIILRAVKKQCNAKQDRQCRNLKEFDRQANDENMWRVAPEGTFLDSRLRGNDGEGNSAASKRSTYRWGEWNEPRHWEVSLAAALGIASLRLARGAQPFPHPPLPGHPLPWERESKRHFSMTNITPPTAPW
ncbi:hypothetical protein AGMMS50256_06710 [Betaproteobacteria bacterium]|nr:hypothetical protein AGMMS50256_06710 [Betaproteobacteria bacterium]